MTDTHTMALHEQVQRALSTLICAHPDEASCELEKVLAQIDSDSPDAAVIKRAIDWLEEIAIEITRVEDLLGEHEFSFGEIRDNS